MGPNLTEQRAARSVSTLHSLCKQFDSESNVPATTSAHSTKSDTVDIQKVVSAVLSNNFIKQCQNEDITYQTESTVELEYYQVD